MKSLVLALCAEGPGDHLFLPIVIQRTSRQLLEQHKQKEVRALPESMSYLSIRQAAADIRSGLITPTELVAETLERIDALDDDIKAFVTVLRDQAFEDAERLEREMRTGLYRSQLHGIPIGVKDITSRR